MGSLRRQARDPDFGLKVFKQGACTRLTEGEILGLDESTYLRIHAGLTVRYESLFAVLNTESPFARRGDSGSVVFDEDRSIVGLVVGLNEADDIVYCSPMSTILEQLGVTL